MRQGCDQVKIMMSGGVASPYDPLDSLQFSVNEVTAAVEEAHAFGRYVCAHAYTPEAITRAANAGVRTIEHGNRIDDASAKLMAEKGMFLVANLVTYFEMKKHAADYGMTSDRLAKNDLVIDGALKSLEICKRHGVPVAYGTDLLGQLQVAQSDEFTLRAEVLSPAEIIRSATTIGAEVVRMEGRLGCLKPGALADLIVVDGNPLENLALLQDEGRHLSVIMKRPPFMMTDRCRPSSCSSARFSSGLPSTTMRSASAPGFRQPSLPSMRTTSAPIVVAERMISAGDSTSARSVNSSDCATCNWPSRSVP